MSTTYKGGDNIITTTAYVITDNKYEQKYYLPRTDYILIVNHVITHKCDEYVVELRPAKQSEIRNAQPLLDLPRIKLPERKTFRCVREVYGSAPKIWAVGWDMSTMTAIDMEQTP